jgi:hypothetical protein
MISSLVSASVSALLVSATAAFIGLWGGVLMAVASMQRQIMNTGKKKVKTIGIFMISFLIMVNDCFQLGWDTSFCWTDLINRYE